MKPSDFQKTIQCQFESKLKKVVKGIVKNYQKELRSEEKRMKFHSVNFQRLLLRNLLSGTITKPTILFSMFVAMIFVFMTMNLQKP